METVHPETEFAAANASPPPGQTVIRAPDYSTHSTLHYTADGKPVIHQDTAETSYLFGSSGTGVRPAWSDSGKGRAFIRFFSRGVVGSLFFVLGGRYATKVMTNYEPENWQGFREENWLRTIAKGVDAGPAKIISKITGDPNSTRFRTWIEFTEDARNHVPGAKTGRSLGSEIVHVTFDFFSASIGDALTRNVFQSVDPNVKQPWYRDKDGNPTVRGQGHFDFGEWTKSLGRSSWRILSKNAGEDWAASLPYVYQMKWQRRAINRIGKNPDSLAAQMGLRGQGFKRASDHNINGAIAQLDENGIINGSFQWEGALDLHWRFIGYNWYTLMYREAYDAVARGFKSWGANGHHVTLPTIEHPLQSGVHTVTDTLRYVTKSFIKANLYMQPAVIPFWLMRVPQTKWRGQYTYRDPDTRKWHPLRTMESAESYPLYPRAKLINTPESEWPPDAYIRDTQTNGWKRVDLPDSNDPGYYKNIGNPFQKGIKRNAFEGTLNEIGKVSSKTGSLLTRVTDKILPIDQANPGAMHRKMFGDNPNYALEREKLIRQTVDAAYAYTPYMWMKAETALRVDERKNNESEGNMDRAIYSLIDNAARLRAQDTWQSVKNIFHLAVTEEKSLVSREGTHHLQFSGGDGTGVPQYKDVAANDAGTMGTTISAPPTIIQTRDATRTGTAHPKAQNDNIVAANDDAPHEEKKWSQSVHQQKHLQQEKEDPSLPSLSH